MKRILILLLIPLYLFSCTTNSNERDTTPVPYGEDEFSPGWKKVRRAEVLLFGSLPLFYMFTSLGYDSYYDFSSSDPPDSDTQLGQKMLITVSLSGALVLADFIIGEIQEKRERKDENTEY